VNFELSSTIKFSEQTLTKLNKKLSNCRKVIDVFPYEIGLNGHTTCLIRFQEKMQKMGGYNNVKK
jgi:hypothetical protein